MTLFMAYPVDRANPFRGLLPLWIGSGVYALLLLAGNRLLLDPDTMWQVTVGQWILDHRAVPVTDVYSFTMRGERWISTQWLAQVVLAGAFRVAGWSGPVVVAASSIAAAFALLALGLSRRLGDSAVLVFVAMALAVSAPHLMARPHVLAMPVMVLWVGALIAAADRGAAPCFALLPLMVLWANLHGGFVFGLVMLAPVAFDAVCGVAPERRMQLAARWVAFSLAAMIAGCCTPYGWNSLLASQKILSLGGALPLITEWRPSDFGSLGVFEIVLLLGLGLALSHGIKLPPRRILLLLGLLHLALAQARAAELLGLLAPLVVAAPLAPQLGRAAAVEGSATPAKRGAVIAGLATVLVAGTLVYSSQYRFAPNVRQSPVAAVAALKQLHVSRVFNDYDFGGYLIENGVAPFIDGRTELYGEKFFVDHNAASGLTEPENLFRLLEIYHIEATLLRTQSAATKLLDHIDGWQKIYADEIATVHVRKPLASHRLDPAVAPDPR